VTSSNRATHLVLSDAPERRRMRTLQAALDERRDAIAELDLVIETLRDDLAAFEAHTQARLAEEHDALRRIDDVTRHLERWAQLLAEQPRESVGKRGYRLEERRRRELHNRPSRQVEVSGAAEPEPELEDPGEPSDRLKAAYRSLARRFHPDLARTEAERVRHGQMMARINILYRQGDVARLEALAEQAKGGELEAEDVEVDEQLTVLEERLAWFEAVIDNLREERRNLESSATCELRRNVEQGAALGRDLIAELKEELRQRVEHAYGDITSAVRILEAEVQRYNRDKTRPTGLSRTRGAALERVFDPFADKRLIRASLEAIATANVSGAARELAEWIEVEAPSRPAVLRLLLFCHVSELSPFPLGGLETYDDLELRFDHLGLGDEEPVSLARALVEADDMVEYGVRRATDEVARTALRFTNETTRDAVLVALRSLPVRRQLKEILLVLGERVTCSSCSQESFAVPLYRTRGLDDLRAEVCPLCGHTLSSYWMPKGQDVQAVLNPAYIDFEILSEYSFRLARTSVATQLLPVQVASGTVGDLKKLLFKDLFDRYQLGVKRGQVRLLRGKKPVPERTALEDLDHNQFVVRFAKDAPMNEADALEMLRHRIRNRFKPD
jgi:hypothetical protein